MSAETILKMIEIVDPADKAKLDEIDALVSFYIDPAFGYNPKRYTRSRGALKAVRPEGWEWYMSQDSSQKGVIFGCASDNIGTNQMQSPMLPTEELAELHAIIQAIEYDRSKNDR